LRHSCVATLSSGIAKCPSWHRGSNAGQLAPLQRLSGSGVEVFSLIRDSDLPPKEYLDQFFDTGTEHQGKTDSSGNARRRRCDSRPTVARTRKMP
jgi:hypothetical protein